MHAPPGVTGGETLDGHAGKGLLCPVMDSYWGAGASKSASSTQELAVFDCWKAQLKAERKSRHTIRAYERSEGNCEHDSTREDSIGDGFLNVDVEQAHILLILIAGGGRVDIRVRRVKPSSINARIAACTHSRWIGHSLPEWVTRPTRRRPLQRLLKT